MLKRGAEVLRDVELRQGHLTDMLNVQKAVPDLLAASHDAWMQRRGKAKSKMQTIHDTYQRSTVKRKLTEQKHNRPDKGNKYS